MQALSQIRQIDYTVIFARDMAAMRHFYETVMEFPLLRTLSDRWVEYRVGANTLALTTHGGRFDDPPPQQGVLSLQLAFRVSPQAVAQCAAALEAKGVKLTKAIKRGADGNRQAWIEDPDGNRIELMEMHPDCLQYRGLKRLREAGLAPA